MLKGQFILTKELLTEPGHRKLIDGWFLYYNDIELTIYKSEFTGISLYLLGYIYDWEHPHLTNYDILRNISAYHFDSSLLNRYSGHFILIHIQGDSQYIINDCCSQYEVFYDTDFEVFASQPKFIERDKRILEDDFYNSDEFLKNRLFVDDTTHLKNVKHLKPNHFLDLKKKKVYRFFPFYTLVHRKDVIPKATEMLKGYIESASRRKKLALGLTAGYDTRVLFGCTLDVQCEYFVVKTPQMKWNDPDIQIPQRICERYKKDFKIVYSDLVKINGTQLDYWKDYQGNSIRKNVDFPIWLYTKKDMYNDHQFLNGTCSEIARRYWDNYRPSGQRFAQLMGYKSEFVVQKYSDWIEKNRSQFDITGYNTMDMFYWEERHLNFVAKCKQIIFGNREVWSPFNSRDLLNLLLSVPEKQRDYYFNELYLKWIDYLTPKLKGIPINPFWRTRGIKLMKRLRIYKPYKNLMI